MKRLTCFGALLAAIVITAGCDKLMGLTEAELYVLYNHDTYDDELVLDEVEAIGGMYLYFTVVSSHAWKMASLAATDNWVTVSPQSGRMLTDTDVEVYFTENRDPSPRSVDLVLSTGDKSITVTVRQAGRNEFSANFTEARWDIYNGGDKTHAIYILDLYDASHETGLSLSLYSDHYEDKLRSTPADGTYTRVNRENYAKFTFNAEESGYFDPETDHAVPFFNSFVNLKQTSPDYYVIEYNIEFGDRVLVGTYEGDIYTFIGGKDDIHVDFNKLGDHNAGARTLPDSNMWQIEILGRDEEDNGVIVTLTANGALGKLPTGYFPMATDVRKGVMGTAESASAYPTDPYFNYGCWYDIDYYDIHEYMTNFNNRKIYAVPGEGFVRISPLSVPYSYEIEFSFTTPRGGVVSGSYRGTVNY